MNPTQVIFIAICGLIMALHADGRFNTPLRNRSTTRRRLYQQARLSYICVTVLVLFILAWILKDFWHFPVKESSQDSQLLELLIALVFLTDGIPHIPFLSEIDRTLLDFFKRVANIPKEVQRCAEQLKPELLRIEGDDLSILTAFIEDEGTLPNELRCHLRADQGDPVDISEYRFTRVLKLYKALMDLASSSKYERFFGDYAEEWEQAQDDFQKFCLRSVTSLELAVKYRADNAVAVHKELLEDIQENFRLRCRERFCQLALLLAGALVSSVPDEEQLATALRQIGFEVNYEDAIAFPVDELSQLAVILFVSVFAVYACVPLLLPRVGVVPTSSARIMWPLLTVLSYFTAMTVTITWLVAHPRAITKRIRPWGKYIVCAVLAGMSVAVLCGIFLIVRYLSNEHFHWLLIPRLSLAIATMCFVVAILCETEVGDDLEHTFRHLAEGIWVGGTMLLAEVVLDLYLGPLPLDHEILLGVRTITFTLIVPTFLATIVGFWVPHMYRMSCRFERSTKASHPETVEPRKLQMVRTAAGSDAVDREARYA
jgi:hypothetical protein